MKIYREPEPTKILDQWRPGDYDGPDGPPDQTITPVLPDKPEEDNRDLEEIKQSLLHPVRETPTKAIQAETVRERVKEEADREITFYDHLTKIYEMEVESAKDEKDVKKIKKAFHKFADEHPIKSKPWWPCNWMDNYGSILIHLKKYPRSWDFMNAVENYDRLSTREIEEIVKETNKKHSVNVVVPNIRYLAFVADAEFYRKMSVTIGRAESVVRKYLAALCELGALKKIGVTGPYHNLPVYTFGYYTGAVLHDKIPLFAHFFTQEYVKQKERTS